MMYNYIYIIIIIHVYNYKIISQNGGLDGGIICHLLPHGPHPLALTWQNGMGYYN